MDTPTASRFGETGASEGGASRSASVCPHCGQRINAGLEQFLGKLGVDQDVIDRIRKKIDEADIEQHLNQARDYLRNNGDKAREYAKKNPGKIAAGVAVLALGAGLLISATRR